METPLTPLEFARRARKLYPERVAVIDGDSHWTYAQFLDRCDRWSAVLQKLGIKPGDRVAYLSPNTHAQLESFYAVPQTGAVLVPLNYRLTADDFVYLINHSGSRMVCADREYLGTIDSIREQIPKVEHFVALTGEAERWHDLAARLEPATLIAVRLKDGSRTRGIILGVGSSSMRPSTTPPRAWPCCTRPSARASSSACPPRRSGPTRSSCASTR